MCLSLSLGVSTNYREATNQVYKVRGMQSHALPVGVGGCRFTLHVSFNRSNGWNTGNSGNRHGSGDHHPERHGSDLISESLRGSSYYLINERQGSLLVRLALRSSLSLSVFRLVQYIVQCPVPSAQCILH